MPVRLGEKHSKPTDSKMAGNRTPTQNNTSTTMDKEHLRKGIVDMFKELRDMDTPIRAILLPLANIV